MRIITWNCCMKFREKFDAVSHFEADVMVIPESESPEQLSKSGKTIPCNSHVWIGDKPAKGLSIFTFNDLTATLKQTHNEDHRLIAPIEITGPDTRLDLLAVWMKGSGSVPSYIVDANRAVDYYLDGIDEDTIVLGDFNSSGKWDERHSGPNHKDLVTKLESRGLISLYHTLSDEAHGHESQATYYQYRHLDKPFHIDHVFLHRALLGTVQDLSIGAHEKWSKHSDHMPVILDLDIQSAPGARQRVT